MTKLYWFATIFLLVACTTYTPEVNIALESAGENRAEMEKVLSHFKSKGNTAYKAASFIIANMPYHKSYTTIRINSSYEDFFRTTDSIYNFLFGNMEPAQVLSFNSKEYDQLRSQAANNFKSLPPPQEMINEQWDIRCVSAEFLIKNISQAIRQWETDPKLKKMPFDEFCEFILPYRVTDEPMMVDKEEIEKLYHNILYGSELAIDITDMIERYKAYVNKCRWINKNTTPQAHAGIYDLLLPKFKYDCHNIASWTANIFRANGIPMVYEYTPQWQDRTKRHFWCATPDRNGILSPFTPAENNLMEDWESDLRFAGKVYRKTFGTNKNTPYFLRKENEVIPEEFNTPLLSDQTYRYHQTVSLSIPFNEDTENNLGYLCFFSTNEEGINPVAWGKIDNKKNQIVFEQVPLNIVFFPAYYADDSLVPFCDPFMLQADSLVKWIAAPHSGSVRKENILELKEGKLHHKRSDRCIEEIRYCPFIAKGTQDISITRKYQDKRTLRKMRERLSDAVIIASQQRNGPYDTLYWFNSAPHPHLQEVSFENKKAYRYYRFATKDKSPTNIAHLEFLGKPSNILHCSPPTALPRFSPDDPIEEKNILSRVNGTTLKLSTNPHHAFDNDYSTYVASYTLGMDFMYPICIEAIRFIPRNANNMIVPGDQYELYYYDNGWLSIERKEAETTYISFNDVPSGVIYWLKNISHGREEHPFTFQNKKQMFININRPLEN